MSNDKPRLTEVTDAELDTILADRSDLARPYIFSSRVNNRIHFFANAEDLKAWRAGSTSTSASDAVQLSSNSRSTGKPKVDSQADTEVK
jgi:hypothetical protein